MPYKPSYLPDVAESIGESLEEFPSEDTLQYPFGSEALASLSVDDVTAKEFIQRTGRSQVWRCDSDVGEFYVVEAVPSEDHAGRHDQSDSGAFFTDDFEPANRFGRFYSRFESYELARRLGVPVVPHEFGDNYTYLLTPGGNDSLRQLADQLHEGRRGGVAFEDPTVVDQDEFITQTAKLLLLGCHDLKPGNIIGDNEGRFGFIDIETTGMYTQKIWTLYRGHQTLGKSIKHLAIQQTAVFLSSVRARDIASFLVEHERVKELNRELEVSQFEESIERRTQNFPLGASASRLVERDDFDWIETEADVWEPVPESVFDMDVS